MTARWYAFNNRCIKLLLELSFLTTLILKDASGQFLNEPDAETLFVPLNNRVVLSCSVEEGYVVDWVITLVGDTDDAREAANSIDFRDILTPRNFTFIGVESSNSTASFGLLNAAGEQANNGTIIACVAQQGFDRVSGNRVQVIFYGAPPSPTDLNVTENEVGSLNISWSLGFIEGVPVNYTLTVLNLNTTSAQPIIIAGLLDLYYMFETNRSCDIYNFTVTAVTDAGNSIPTSFVWDPLCLSSTTSEDEFETTSSNFETTSNIETTSNPNLAAILAPIAVLIIIVIGLLCLIGLLCWRYRWSKSWNPYDAEGWIQPDAEEMHRCCSFFDDKFPFINTTSTTVPEAINITTVAALGAIEISEGEQMEVENAPAQGTASQEPASTATASTGQSQAPAQESSTASGPIELTELMEDLHVVAANYHALGIQLRLDPTKLEQIKADVTGEANKVEYCFQKVLETWKAGTQFTKPVLLKALVKIDERGLANRLESNKDFKVEELQPVVKALEECKAKYFRLGIFLGLSHQKIKSFESYAGNCARCLDEVLIYYVETMNPSVEEVCEAVKMVGQTKLANYLRDTKYKGREFKKAV